MTPGSRILSAPTHPPLTLCMQAAEDLSPFSSLFISSSYHHVVRKTKGNDEEVGMEYSTPIDLSAGINGVVLQRRRPGRIFVSTLPIPLVVDTKSDDARKAFPPCEVISSVYDSFITACRNDSSMI